MMTANQYRAALDKIGISQRGAAKWLGVGERTSRRWAESGPPKPVAKLLRLVIRLGLKPDQVE